MKQAESNKLEKNNVLEPTPLNTFFDSVQEVDEVLGVIVAEVDKKTGHDELNTSLLNSLHQAQSSCKDSLDCLSTSCSDQEISQLRGSLAEISETVENLKATVDGLLNNKDLDDFLTDEYVPFKNRMYDTFTRHEKLHEELKEATSALAVSINKSSEEQSTINKGLINSSLEILHKLQSLNSNATSYG